MELVGRTAEVRRAADRLASGASVVVTGPPGSGRTAVLAAVVRHVRARADGGDRLVHLVAGRETLPGIPLAPVAPMITAAGLDPTGTLGVYTRLPALLRRAGALVAIDDVEHLDRATGVLLAQLARAGVPLLLTAGSEAVVPRQVRDELALGSQALVALAPLGVDDVLELARRRLGEDLDVASSARLVRAGGGRPGTVVELLEAGRPGTTSTPGGLRLGPGVLTERLRAAAEQRLAPLTEESRVVVDLAVASNGLPEAILEPRAVDPALEAGVLQTRDSAGGSVVEVPDPVLAAVVSEQIGAAGARRLRERARELLSTVPGGDARRALLAAIDDVPLSTEDACRAARFAIEEHRYAEALRALAAWSADREPSAEFLLLRGTARAACGPAEDAAADLARAAGTPTHLVAAGRELGLLLAVRCGDPGRAVEAVTELVERAEAGSGGTPAALVSDLVKWRLMAGLDVAAAPGPTEVGETAERLALATIEAMIGCLDGPLDRARSVVEHALADAATAAAVPAHAEDLLRLSRMLVEAFSGEVEEALALAHTHRDGAIRREHPSAGMWEFAAAEVALHTARIRLSRNLAARAARHLAWQDFTGLRESALALTAAAEARLGHPEEARRWYDQVPNAARADVKVDLHLARVETALRAPDARDDAGARLAETGLRALAEQHTHLGLLAVDEAFVMTGDPGRRRAYADVLVEHRGRSRLFGALAERAEAYLVGEERGIERAADLLASLGLTGRAVHAYERAARLHRARGAREAALRLRTRAAELAALHDAASWPPHDVAQLSAREQEIARLAAGRARSREIADALGLSVRTVDNHLARVFRKLGVASRDELADAFGGDVRTEV